MLSRCLKKSAIIILMTKWELALRLAGVGFYIGGSIVLGVFLGLWLDDRFKTRPILAIIGLILGVINAFYGVYRLVLPLIGNNNSK